MKTNVPFESNNKLLNIRYELMIVVYIHRDNIKQNIENNEILIDGKNEFV